MIRAVLGRRVREILETHFFSTKFFAPDAAFAEALEHLPQILQKRGVDPEAALSVLSRLRDLIGCIEVEVYKSYKTAAQQRLQLRDEDDWPVLASALALDCPIWTEDADFFGTGVATWTTNRIELWLASSTRRA